MMKARINITVSLFILAAAALAFGQSAKLSATFSQAAVAALRAINATGWTLPSSVRELEARQANAQDKMEAAKEAAQSEDDADTFVYLQRYQYRHSENFAAYSNAIARTANKLTGKDALQRAAAIVDKDPKFVVIKRRELACSAAIEKALQAKLFSPPAACDLY
jgi:cysteine synthase